MKLRDFKGLFKKYQLHLSTSKNPHGDYHLFDFNIPDNMTWTAGEHGIFSIPDKHITGKKWRAFSVASAPAEGVLKIATRIGSSPSSFKSALQSLKPGETIKIRGPFGWFKLQDQTSPVIMVAGGVGIAPIRALLKTAEKNNNRQISCIYSAPADHLFRKELEVINEKQPNIRIDFVNNRERVVSLLDEYTEQYGARAWYYLSGTPTMTKDIQKKIKGQKIPGKRIIIDPFLGY